MRNNSLGVAFQITLRAALKRYEGRSVLYIILDKEVHAVKHTFWPRLAACNEEQMPSLMILVLFCI